MTVDPVMALQDIDAKKYPEFPDGFYISRLGLQLHMAEDIQDKADNDQKINALKGALSFAEEQTRASITEAARNAWWARWAPALILGASTAFAVIGFGLGVVVGAKVGPW